MVFSSYMFRYIIYVLSKHTCTVFFCSTQKERNNYCVLNNKITVADDKKLSADYNWLWW